MAQSTFEKTMRNVSLSDTGRTPNRRNFSRRNWRFDVEISPNEIQKLNQFIKLELEYYNWIVSGFSSRLRSSPDSFFEITDEIEDLFLQCAELSFDPYRYQFYRNDDDLPLPKEFKKYENLLFGFNTLGNRKFTDKVALFCQLVSEKAPLVKDIRRRMALEILNFFKKQAKVTLQGVPKHLQSEQEYKVAPQALEVLDVIRKRHLQIPKNCLLVNWNEDEGVSEFKIPYYSKKIIVPGVNFAEEKNWNFAILHQTPGVIASTSTPWVLDIRHYQGLYITGYTDVQNIYGSSFNQSKRSRSF